MWTSISLYLRHLSPTHVFRLERFLNWVVTAISSSGLKPGIIQPDQHKILRRSIIASCLKGLFPLIPLEHSLFTLFCAGFVDAAKAGKIAMEDFKIIASHLAGELRARVDITSVESGPESLDQLKFINIVNIFPWIHKFIGTIFGPNYTNFVPIFSIDSFISPSSFSPAIILVRHGMDPIPPLDHLVAMRNRVDSFGLFSTSDDDIFLAKFPDLAHTAMSAGSWVAIEYTTPSRAVESRISDLVDLLCQAPQIPPTFRLIVFANTAAYLPMRLLMRATRVNCENFPSVRQQILSVFQHHSALIRSSTNAKVMKKLSYATTLLYSVVNFRSFVTPLGLQDHLLINEHIMKSVLMVLRAFIHAHSQEELPIRNIRDILQDCFIGSCCLDTFDRRKLRAHVYGIMTPEVIADHFVSIDESSEEAEIWMIPADAPITNYAHHIEKIPLFTTADVLYMARRSSTFVVNWNYSRWIIQPFLTFVSEDPIKEDRLAAKMQVIANSLPQFIPFTEQAKSPLFTNLLCEVRAFNRGLAAIRRQMSEANQQTASCIWADTVPPAWKEFVGYAGTDAMRPFLALLEAEVHRLSGLVQFNGIPSKNRCHFHP
jgi:hypothetical protein